MSSGFHKSSTKRFSIPREEEDGESSTSPSFASKRQRRVLAPGASVMEFGQHVAALYPIRGWKGTPILSTFRPDGYAEDEKEVEWIDDDFQLQVNMVKDKECKKVCIANESYKKKESGDDDTDVNDDKWENEKNRVNKVVCLLKSMLRRKRQEVVVLDHYKMRTSTLLAKELGLKRTQIHVPNPDPDFTTKIGSRLAKIATVTHETLFEWINRQDTEDEDLVAAFDVLADYCCTWEGNGQCEPSVDLHAMFRKTLLAKTNGVLWLTFSTRASSASEVANKVKRWVAEEALHFDYALNLAYEQAYGTVVTFVYVTGRNNLQTNFSYLNQI